MEIKILGRDCADCHLLVERTIKALSQLNIEGNVEKVEDPEDVWAYGLLQPPAIVIDGHVVSQGKLYTITELRELILQQQHIVLD